MNASVSPPDAARAAFKYAERKVADTVSAVGSAIKRFGHKFPITALLLSVVLLLSLTARSVDVVRGGARAAAAAARGEWNTNINTKIDAKTDIGTNRVRLPSAKSRQAARHHHHADKFPICPEAAQRVDPELTDGEAAAVGTDSDRDDQRTADVKHLIAAVKSSGVRAQPFKSSVHICQPFRRGGVQFTFTSTPYFATHSFRSYY